MKALAKVADESLYALAKSHFDAADGDIVVATETLTDAVLNDQDMRNRLTDPLISTACYNLIAGMCRQERQRIWTAPNYSQQGHGDRVVTLAEGNLMSLPLPGGKKLGDATREEVWSASDDYEKRGKDMLHKSRFLALIGQSLPDNTTVRDVLTEDRLRELKNATKHR